MPSLVLAQVCASWILHCIGFFSLRAGKRTRDRNRLQSTELFSRDNESHPVKCLPDSSQMYPWVSKLLTQSCSGSNTLDKCFISPIRWPFLFNWFQAPRCPKVSQLIPPLLMLLVIKAKITNYKWKSDII